MSATFSSPDASGPRFQFVVYENMAQTTGKQVRVPLDEFAQICTYREVREEKDGPLFSLAYGDSISFEQRRSDVIGVSGFVVDVDFKTGERQVSELVEDVKLKLGNCAFGFYTTYSHRDDSGRIRLVVPLRTPLNGLNFDDAYVGLVHKLGMLQTISMVSGQSRARYPLPSCPEARQHMARQGWIPGELIDPQEFIGVAPDPYYVSKMRWHDPDAQKKHLEKVASEFIRRGESRDAVAYALIREEDKFIKVLHPTEKDERNPNDWAKARKTENEMRAAINSRRKAEGQEPLIGDALLTDQFSAVDIKNLAQLEIVPPSFAIEKILPSGEVTLFAAHGGAGKSTLASIFAAHFAVRRCWAGLNVMGGNVLYVSLEESADVARGRYKNTAKRYDLDTYAMEASLTILDGSLGDSALVRESVDSGVRKLIPTASMLQIRQKARAAKLIVIDNASLAFHGDENNRQMVSAFISELRKLARLNNAAILLLAHIDKQAARYDSRGNTFSGSTAWHNAVRSRLALKEDGELQVLVQEKSNLGRKIEPIALRWTDEGVLVPVEANGENEQAIVAADALAIVAAMSAAKADGQNVPFGPTGSYVPQKALSSYAELPKHLRGPRNRDRFWRRLNYLVSTGQVAKETYRNSQSKSRYRFVLTEAAPYTPHTPSA